MAQANLREERRVLALGDIAHIAGLDEAGRGALAGPVVAAAVVLPLGDASALEALAVVNDSKQLTAVQRTKFYDLIVQHAAAYGIGAGSAADIDRDGILPATRQAMRRALDQLTHPPDYLLIDGRIRLAQVNIRQESLVRGDSRSLSIAAASILAKVTRDRQMIAYDADHDVYGFAQHKGYGTQQHRDAIERHGPCEIHRRSFAPLRHMLV